MSFPALADGRRPGMIAAGTTGARSGNDAQSISAHVPAPVQVTVAIRQLTSG
jgi:hypothetical protein